MMRLLAACLLAASVLALGACNSDDDTSGPALPSGRTAAPQADSDAGQASKLAAKFLAGVDGKYTYLYTGAFDNVTEGTLTIFRLDVNDRQDWTTNSFGFVATTITVLAADENYVCTQAQGFNSCHVSTVQELESLRFISLPIYDALAALVEDSNKFEFEDLPDETAAGIAGACFRAFSETLIGQGPPASEEIKTCFAADGALLYLQRITTPDSQSIDPTTFTVELQESGEALPADFDSAGRLQ